MDARLAITSKRDVRTYASTVLTAETERRILDAGRLAGTASNRQPCRFIVVEGTARVDVARAVYVPPHIITAALVVAIAVTPGGGLVDFDAGRVAQNMMLAAWAEGVGSCPNGVSDPEVLSRALELTGEERVPIVISFGVSEPWRDPARRSPERWSETARRLPLSQLVRRVGDVA